MLNCDQHFHIFKYMKSKKPRAFLLANFNALCIVLQKKKIKNGEKTSQSIIMIE